MRKKMRGLGVKPKVIDLGMREEQWEDGWHVVHAFQGVDRRVWIRFRPNPGFRFGRFHWCRAKGRGRH